MTLRDWHVPMHLTRARMRRRRRYAVVLTLFVFIILGAITWESSTH